MFLCVLAACNDDDDFNPRNKSQDTANPSIYLLSPVANTTYLVINRVDVHASLSDDTGLGSARTLLVDADGNRKAVTEPIVFQSNTTSGQYGSSFNLRGVEPGTYTLVIEVRDQASNMAKDSVAIKVHAPDLNKTEFSEAFEKGSFFYNLEWGWFGLDFTHGIEFDETQFSTGVYMMINISTYMKENEWEKFVQDFGFEKQSWSTWDANRNGELDELEFHNGLKRLDLFKKWDANNDRMVRADEFAQGIFKSWDLNQDDMLTKAEYQDKFYYYVSILRD